MIEWKIKYGDQEIKITANDVAESIGRALGLMYYKLENDEKLKAHVQIKIVHEMDIQILELAKAQFLGLIEDERKRHPHMSIPGKKRRRPNHAIQGKPGDIVEVTPKKEKP